MASEPFPVASKQAWLPLTAAQLGVYFLHQLRPGLPVCTTAELITLPDGIETDRLVGALNATYLENEQLRVRLRTGPTGPEQQVTETLPTVAVVEVADRAAADDWVEAALAMPFDLDAGEVVRTAILCVAGEPRWWLHAAHHVVLDGYGFIRLAGRVGEHYRGAARPAPTVSVAELVAEDHARREPGALAAEQEFWADRLAEAEGSSSLAGQTADATTPVHRAAVALPTETQEALVAAAGTYGVAWTDLATAAFAAYLGRLAPGDPAVVRLGVPFMDRFVPGRGAWLTAKTVCTAMNVLPVSVGVTDGDVAGLVAATAAELAAIRDHVTVRHEDLARDLRHRVGPGTALFGPQVNLLPFSTAVNFGIGSGAVRNVTAGPVEDMTWTIRGAVGRGQPVWLEVAGNPALYDADEVQVSADRLLAWLATFATAAGNASVSELPLLSEAERRQVLEAFNATERPDLLAAAQTLPEAFSAQVAATPEAVALIDADRTWTYAELSAAAQRVRVELRDRGLPQGAAVGVALPRDARLYVAVHGIVAAGSPYVPLDPEQPMARSAEIVADAEIGVVVAGADSMAELPAGLTVIDLDRLLADGADEPDEPASADRGPRLDDPAYLIFTSGSTGRPKGVVVTHRAIANRLAWMQELYPLHPGDRVLHKTPYTFDVSVWELFWPLQVGATVVIAPPGAHRDPRALAGLITDHRVHTLHFVPSMLRAFLGDPVSVQRLQAAGSPVRQLFCSGEALPRDLVEQAADVFGTWAINLYGPTEAAVDVTGWVAAPGEAEVPIGRPLPNVRCYVLDRWGGPVPVGTIGHLYLAGVQLALGYAGRPDLTAAAFVHDPFVDGERMYATGDLARWRPDGALCYEGRADAQIKIAGQRVEPGEVETVLRTAPGVETAAVLAVSGPAGLRLAAYVILASPVSDSWRAELSFWLSDRLPSHMVPSILQRVDAFPTTSSGKLDRRALLAAGGEDEVAAEVVVPTSWLEEQIAATMSALLGATIGADDDFFDAGGSSLLAVRLLGELESLAGRQLALADVFTAPTPRRMAQRMLGAPSTPADDLAPVLTLRPGEPGVTPLITLPPAGGLGWCYAGLLRHLPPSVPVYALQADIGSEADQPTSLDALAERYLERVRPLVGEGGCHLLGWSLGGMAAHAVAELAIRTGVPVGAVIMVDAYPGEQWRQLPEPTEQDGLLALVRMGGVEHLIPEGATLDLPSVQTLLSREGSALAGLSDQVREAVIGNALVGARLVRSSTHRRLDRDVCLVVAGAPRPETWLDPAGWEPHVGGIVHQVVLDGAHHQLLREPMIADLGELTSKALADW